MSYQVEVLESPARRVRWRVPVVVVLVVVALAGLGGGGWLFYQSTRGPLPTPDAPWPTTATFTVFLCGEDLGSKPCTRRALETEKKAIEHAIRSNPEASEVRFVTQLEAWEDFKTNPATDQSMLQDAKLTDMAGSFKGTLRTASDEFAKKVEALPGVLGAHVRGTSFWVGKADFGIVLCGLTPYSNAPLCKGRATEAEKAAVFERLGALDGVGTIYFEDRRHFQEVYSRSHASFGPIELDNQAFHVKLDDPAAGEAIRRAVGTMPGVDSLIRH